MVDLIFVSTIDKPNLSLLPCLKGASHKATWWCCPAPQKSNGQVFSQTPFIWSPKAIKTALSSTQNIYLSFKMKQTPKNICSLFLENIDKIDVESCNKTLKGWTMFFSPRMKIHIHMNVHVHMSFHMSSYMNVHVNFPMIIKSKCSHESSFITDHIWYSIFLGGPNQ